MLRECDQEKLTEASLIVKSVETHQETQKLMLFDQMIPTESIITLAEILKMLPEDLTNIQETLASSHDDKQLWCIVQTVSYFGVADGSLQNLKNMLDEADNVVVERPKMIGKVVAKKSVEAVKNEEGVQIVVHKNTQPVSIYHSILKPHPAVKVYGYEGPMNSLRVKAVLVASKDDSEQDELPYLEGTKIVAFKDNIAVFRKLKITATSSQIGGNPFFVRFILMTENKGEQVDVPGVIAFSDPITVYSHSSYLGGTKKKKSPQKEAAQAPAKRRKRKPRLKKEEFSDENESNEIFGNGFLSGENEEDSDEFLPF